MLANMKAKQQKLCQKSYSHKIFSTAWFCHQYWFVAKAIKSRRDFPLGVWSMVLWISIM